jgi:hypothetical protein
MILSYGLNPLFDIGETVEHMLNGKTLCPSVIASVIDKQRLLAKIYGREMH